MNIVWLLVGVVVLGVMVLVHEWGHFIVAKLCGVRVDIFSIGFGPRLFGLRRHPTDYRVSALPLGGYVKMAGDNPGEERCGAPDEFLSRPRWQRVLIALAGPTMNVLMAVLLLTGLFYYRYERPAFLDEPAVVGAVRPDSPAARAGFEPGDRIVRFAQTLTPTWEEVLLETALGSSGATRVEVERAGGTTWLELVLPENIQEQPWEVGWVPDERMVVQMVQPDTPAAAAGLQAGDVLKALNGEPLRPSGTDSNPLSDKLQLTAGQPVVLSVNRQGVEQQITVSPVYGDHPEGKRWVLGLNVGYRMVRKNLSLYQAFKTSAEENWRNAGRMLALVGRLFTGRASLRGVQGPVGIVRFSGEAGEQGGVPAVVNLAVLISLSLGILNLLPIPVLDGGHIALLAIEGGLQRDLSLGVKERIIQAGLVFLLLLFAVVMYNDIARIFTN